MIKCSLNHICIFKGDLFEEHKEYHIGYFQNKIGNNSAYLPGNKNPNNTHWVQELWAGEPHL